MEGLLLISACGIIPKSLRRRSHAKVCADSPKQNESLPHFGLPLHFAHAAIVIIEIVQFLIIICLVCVSPTWM